MALKPCKECKKEISTEAKVCPHCGKKNPTQSANASAGVGCLAVVVVIFLIVQATGGGSGSSTGSLSPGRVVSSAPTAPPRAGSQWRYGQDMDEMTGRASHFASVESANTVEFGFPYQGAQHGQLTLRRHPRFGSNVLFAVERGQLLCPSYEGCTVLVRFDEGEALQFSANAPADNSTETVFIANYDRFMSKMRGARQVRISVGVYQEGEQTFTFDVSGFDSKRYQGQ